LNKKYFGKFSQNISRAFEEFAILEMRDDTNKTKQKQNLSS